MTDSSRVSAADRAAGQVEQIVGAAQKAADQIVSDARAERDKLIAAGRKDVEKELEAARKEAILLTQDARRDVEDMIGDAKREAADLRAQTDRAVEGRVANAEKAAAEVLAEARALTGGLRQLGRSLEEQAEKILRDVQAAHKRMQADLRVGPSLARDGGSEPDLRLPPRSSDEPERPERRTRSARDDDREPPSDSDSPFEVPSWIGRDG
jgi:cell division septum initiation protein DivIVA